jgi:Alanine racemase, N-terminal domain
MSFRLAIDVPAWNRQLIEVRDRLPGLVPVIKGNGYGFGNALLAERSTSLGVDTVAVGVPSEIAAVRTGFAGDVLVLGPMQLEDLADGAPGSTRGDAGVIRTVAHPEVLDALVELPDPPRIVLELESPMHRHGIPAGELLDLVPSLRRLPLAGLALHLPPVGDGRPAAAAALAAVASLRSAGLEPGTLWVSHLSSADLDWLQRQDPLTAVRLRIGTNLWLGGRTTFTVTGSVLDVRPVPRHEGIGYRRRRSHGGTLLVVQGGTANGVGLQSSSARGGLRGLARAAAAGAAHGVGLAPSPFHWAGRRLRYADVPHMQVSMLLVPSGVEPPRVGDRLRCDVRMTVSTFDEVVAQEGGSVTSVNPVGPGGPGVTKDLLQS